jgi:hypothetical protein
VQSLIFLSTFVEASEVLCSAANLKVEIINTDPRKSQKLFNYTEESFGGSQLKVICSSNSYQANNGYSSAYLASDDFSKQPNFDHLYLHSLFYIKKFQSHAEQVRLLTSIALTAKATQKAVTIIYYGDYLVGLRLE